MRITGHNSLPFPAQTVWDSLLDPAVLVRTIPGCGRLVATGEHTYDMTVTAGVASIRGSYDGTCALSDLVPHESLVMRLQGAGAPGTVDATVRVSFSNEDAGTTIAYDADATVGGMVGGVGQRMLGSVSKRMAKEFFDNVCDAIASADADPGAGAPPDRRPGTVPTPGATGSAGAAGSTGGAGGGGAVGTVYTAPAPRPDGQQEFIKGIAVGAGLVLLGVVAGSLFARGRRR
jgi:carbon monoxide dehydrogenase subunit G